MELGLGDSGGGGEGRVRFGGRRGTGDELEVRHGYIKILRCDIHCLVV